MGTQVVAIIEVIVSGIYCAQLMYVDMVALFELIVSGICCAQLMFLVMVVP